MDEFCVAAVIILQDWDKLAGLNIGAHMKFPNPTDADAQQAELPFDRAARYLKVAGYGLGVDTVVSGIAKRPFVEASPEVEADAVVLVEVFRSLRRPCFFR